MSDDYHLKERIRELHEAISALIEQVELLTDKAGVDECKEFDSLKWSWDSDYYNDDDDY